MFFNAAAVMQFSVGGVTCSLKGKKKKKVLLTGKWPSGYKRCYLACLNVIGSLSGLL